MAKHDILLYNSTSSVFETNLSSNTARIRGDSSDLLALESGSTEVLKVDASTASITITTAVTASGDISGSASSTGSFGTIDVTRLSGDASSMTGKDTYEAVAGHFSGSAQVAVSGAFDSGFRISTASSISGSSISTGSFSHISVTDIDVTHANELIGLINVSESLGTVSSSAQLASAISGAFNQGFTYTGEISGSSTSTGSFKSLFANTYNAAVSASLSGLDESNHISSSAQLASEISGAFNSGFTYTGIISGSSTSTASVDYLKSDNWDIGDISGLTGYSISGGLSSSAQIAGDISGSFLKGFQLREYSQSAFAGNISGSSSSTASFTKIYAEKYIEGGAGTGISLDNQITSSLGFAADISASSEGGFEYDGLISGSSTSTASFAYVKVDDFTVNLANHPQFTTMSQKETFVVPSHISKSYASARTAPTASDLISTSSYTDVLSGNIWINNSDGSLNFAYISGSQTSQSGYLFSKKIVGYETH